MLESNFLEEILLPSKKFNTYIEAYNSLTEYVDDMDAVLLCAGESIFAFENAWIEKTFVREWRD